MIECLRRTLLWGAGGHAKVVADIVRACGGVVVGLIEDRQDRIGRLLTDFEAPVVASDATLHGLLRSSAPLPCEATSVVVAIGDNSARLERVTLLGTLCAPALIHPRATISPSAHVDLGTVVMPAAVINARARIGRAAIVNTGAIVEHDCVIEDGVHLSPGSIACGSVTLGRCVWLGARAVVIPDVSVDTDSIIGAGAVVTRNLPASTVAVGVPARVTRDR